MWTGFGWFAWDFRAKAGEMEEMAGRGSCGRSGRGPGWVWEGGEEKGDEKADGLRAWNARVAGRGKRAPALSCVLA